MFQLLNLLLLNLNHLSKHRYDVHRAKPAILARHQLRNILRNEVKVIILSINLVVESRWLQPLQNWIRCADALIA